MSAPEECPRFQRCGANKCPLHVDYLTLVDLPGEEKCTLGKARRVRIGGKYPDLVYGGLTPREFAWAEKAAKMTPEERENQRQRVIFRFNRGI